MIAMYVLITADKPLSHFCMHGIDIQVSWVWQGHCREMFLNYKIVRMRTPCEDDCLREQAVILASTGCLNLGHSLTRSVSQVDLYKVDSSSNYHTELLEKLNEILN